MEEEREENKEGWTCYFCKKFIEKEAYYRGICSMCEMEKIKEEVGVDDHS